MFVVNNGAEAIEAFGEPRMAIRTATIQKRSPSGEVEIIETQWGPQEAHTGVDYVAIEAGGTEYPYKIDLWENNMEEVADRPGHFRKKVQSKLIAVPEGTVVQCVTIDGGEQKPLEVKAPDFICIGVDDEVYPLAREMFDNEFEWA